MSINQSTIATSIKYRPDVDGLRAIAILAVIGFHAFPKIVKSGFVGVDIFFVISGYLISSIIFSKLAKGNFNFWEFYSRRIRRIFPALITVMLFCMLYGWLILLSDEYNLLGKHIAAGAAFVANIVLRSEAGYFDVASDLKPLLHLWSLGIEEQFYLFYPFLLYLLLKISPRYLLHTILLLLGFSFYLNVVRIDQHPALAFYSIITRFWELMVGSTLAYTKIYGKQSFFMNILNHFTGFARTFGYRKYFNFNQEVMANLRSILGFILLLASIFMLDRHKGFPGWWAVLPTFGAYFMIAAGSEAWLNRKLLANFITVGIGLISYPLYLWHWPLLSFVRIIGVSSIWITCILVICSFVFAWLTYKFVEKPLRHNSAKLLPVILLLAMIFVFLTGGSIYKGKILPHSVKYSLEYVIKAKSDWDYPGANLKPLENLGKYFYGWGKGSRHVLFFGDSNMQQYSPIVDRLITVKPNNTKSVVFATCGGCVPIPGVKEKGHLFCEDFITQALKFAKSDEVDTIVIAATWFSYFTSADYYYDDGGGFIGYLGKNTPGSAAAYQRLENMLSDFRSKNKKVYLILNIPIGGELDPSSYFKRNFFGNVKLNINPGIKKKELLNRYGFIRDRLKEIGIKSGAEVIDPLDYLCKESLCPSISKNGRPIYKDGGHIAASYCRDNIHFLDQVLVASPK